MSIAFAILFGGFLMIVAGVEGKPFLEVARGNFA